MLQLQPSTRIHLQLSQQREPSSEVEEQDLAEDLKEDLEEDTLILHQLQPRTRLQLQPITMLQLQPRTMLQPSTRIHLQPSQQREPSSEVEEDLEINRFILHKSLFMKRALLMKILSKESKKFVGIL
jgi:hypothetical protein